MNVQYRIITQSLYHAKLNIKNNIEIENKLINIYKVLDIKDIFHIIKVKKK